MRPSYRARRHTRLAALGFSSYRDYLHAPHWQATRAAYRASAQPQDCICGETEGLQLHHLSYERVGAERLTDLTPLCDRCHAMVHVLERRGDMGLDLQGFVNEERAKRYEREQAERRRAAKIIDRDAMEERAKSAARSLGVQIREVAIGDVRAGLDPTPFFAAIQTLVSRERDRMRALKTSAPSRYSSGEPSPETAIAAPPWAAGMPGLQPEVSPKPSESSPPLSARSHDLDPLGSDHEAVGNF